MKHGHNIGGIVGGSLMSLFEMLHGNSLIAIVSGADIIAGTLWLAQISGAAAVGWAVQNGLTHLKAKYQRRKQSAKVIDFRQ